MLVVRKHNRPGGRRQRASWIADACILLLLCGGIAVIAGCRQDQDKGASSPTEALKRGDGAKAARSAADLVRSDERGPVKLTVSVDRGEVTIPEKLTLTITIEAEHGVEIAMPEMGELLGDFGVVEAIDVDPVVGDMTTTHERRYKLESFLAGETAIPAIKLTFADPREKADGSHTVYEDALETEAIPITVFDGLADVKGPATLPMPWPYRLLWWASGVLAVVVLIAVAARLWRRYRRERVAALPFARRLVPHEWALAELDKLAAEDLVARGQVQEFYYRINSLARRYIEPRFHLMAGEQTSEEFLRSLQESSLLRSEHKELLRAFVSACDPVKYAQYRPQADEIGWVQTTAREFVIETANKQSGKESEQTSGTEQASEAEQASGSEQGSESDSQEVKT